MRKTFKHTMLCWIIMCCFFSQSSISSVFGSVTSLVSAINDALDIPDKASKAHEVSGGDKEHFAKRKAPWLLAASFFVMALMTSTFIYDKVVEAKARELKEKEKKEKKALAEKSEKRAIALQEWLAKAIQEHNNLMKQVMLPAEQLSLPTVMSGG